MGLPIISFDTSALSRPRSEAILVALNIGFDVWLTAISVDELIATTDENKRERLIADCQRLLASGRCVWPPHEVATLHASAHVSNPATYDWRRVSIRTQVYERAIINRDYTNELCAMQLREQRSLESSFVAFWKGLRLKLDAILDAEPNKRPTSYGQAAEVARSNKPSVLLGIGAELYKRGAKIERTPSDEEMKAFMDVCPPFRSICYGIIGTWFDVSLARQVNKKIAGRNDIMMAAYLPYCGRFVTADRRQEKRLREIAVEAELDCEVLSYNDFVTGFDLSRFSGRVARV